MHIVFLELDRFVRNDLVREHTQKFLKEGRFNFLKTKSKPIVVNLFQLLMKMFAIIVKQGFAVIVAFCCNICFFRNLATTILKVVGCEDCVR